MVCAEIGMNPGWLCAGQIFEVAALDIFLEHAPSRRIKHRVDECPPMFLEMRRAGLQRVCDAAYGAGLARWAGQQAFAFSCARLRDWPLERDAQAQAHQVGKLQLPLEFF